MRRTLSALVVAAAVALVPSLSWAATTPDNAIGQEFTRWHETITLNADGSADVHVEFDFDFGNKPGRGPYISIITRQKYDDDYDRVYQVSNIKAQSPTGAPSRVNLDTGRYVTAVRIGEEDIANVSGQQTYVLTYTIKGILNGIPASELGGEGDEVVGAEYYYNAFGTDFTVPVDGIQITVNAPNAIQQVGCWAGRQGTSDSCLAASQTSNTQVIFEQGVLWPGQPMSIATLFDADGVKYGPELVMSNELKRAFGINAGTVGTSLALLAGGGFLLGRKLRNNAADEQYLGVTPGLAPPPQFNGDGSVIPATPMVGRRDKKAPVAVQFEPPAGLRPGLLGTLLDEVADPRDVTATMVDLAVRGYLVVDASEAFNSKKRNPNYTLIRTRVEDDQLEDFELELFRALFTKGDQVRMDDLKTTFAADMAKVQTALYRNVTARGWFRKNPENARMSWMFSGIFLAAAGVGLAFLLGMFSRWALVGMPLIVLGIAVAATYKAAPARKAEGTRVLQQAQGFELYITKADANQLRFEEGQDIFSRYLPYAVAFGVAEQWTKRFEQLAAQGRNVPEPNWIRGAVYGTYWHQTNQFSSQVNKFVDVSQTSFVAPTPGSSGGSAFGSGGGGFSGGGGGGRGGGGW